MSEQKPANNIQSLYDLLFAELHDLRDNKVDVQHANAVSNVATSLIKAGELEVKFLEVVGGTGTGFVPEADDQLPAYQGQRLVKR